ncbi:YHYH protein [Flavobacterium silvaticum]|uniref:YHYH protein n=1 Tax=Flavobacterium silvaticum TaxID=1852020 RepID=A0A972JJW8_9FLAO|nr:YHYH protein [Flavobacterium silvaticum]NMH28527.1 YHYH protein [Flavobacterium silvaticum]
MKRFLIPIAAVLFFGCNDSEDNPSASAEVPAIYQKIYGATSITSDGTYVYIKSTGTPDHKSVYYPTSNPLYEDFSGTTFHGNTFNKNPNTITTRNYTFKLPITPEVNSAHPATPLGPIGISLNGVPFFNQYAGPNQPLTNEVVSFDQYWGHPAPGGDYHYHVEPLYLTSVLATKSALLGFLLDGFPVYGPQENGVDVTEDALDEFHGHTSITADYPSGIYHYHITSVDPYINGSGFYGFPGTVSN